MFSLTNRSVGAEPNAGRTRSRLVKPQLANGAELFIRFRTETPESALSANHARSSPGLQTAANRSNDRSRSLLPANTCQSHFGRGSNRPCIKQTLRGLIFRRHPPPPLRRRKLARRDAASRSDVRGVFDTALDRWIFLTSKDASARRLEL
jgi:hypothetical protein